MNSIASTGTPKRATRSTFWRLLSLASPLKGWLALATLAGFCTVGAGIGLMSTSAYLISEAALHPSVAALGVAIVGVRFFGISRGIFRYLERYISHYATFGLLARMRVWFYTAIEPLAPARLMAFRSGDLLSRVVSDVQTIQDFYVRAIVPPVVAAMVALVMWFFLGAYDVVFAATLIFFYLLAGVGVPLITHALSGRLGQDLIKARADLSAQIVDGIQGIAELVAFGQEERYQARVARLNRKLMKLQRRMAWVTGLQTALGNLLMNLAMWTMLVVAIPMVRDGRLDGVSLAVLLLATVSSFEAVLPLPGAFQLLGGSLEAARRLFELVDATPAVQDGERPSPVPQDYSLSVRNLRFRYNPGEPLALDNISFTLPQGRCLAIVGPSGAGKSTLANLLLRFWDFEDGYISLGGHELREYRQDDVRRLVSVVAQSTHLFNTTIRANLLIARPDASEEELAKAVQRANLAEFVESLPKGLDTPVGEQGLRLSGGERQRIAIARAFLRDAPILLLDEATANLDALAEQQVLRSVRELAKGRTTLIITHRLVGLDMAGQILVLSSGRIVERGRHQDLVQLEGLYWKMWELQNGVLALQS